MTTQSQAYIAGWNAVMSGADPRYSNPHGHSKDNESLAYAWTHGALDAMEADDGEVPQPEAHDYH